MEIKKAADFAPETLTNTMEKCLRTYEGKEFPTQNFIFSQMINQMC